MELWAIAPELTLAAACFALVPVAGFARGRARAAVPALAALALALALGLSARMLPWPAASVFHGTYAVDGLATVSKLLVLLAALVSLAVMAPSFREEEGLAQAPVAVLFACLGAMLVAAARDLALLLLALEMTSFAGYLLVAQRRRAPDALEATLKYFVFGAVALAIMGYGLSFLYGLTGSLQLAEIGAALRGADRAYALLALVLVLVGFGFEVGLVPLHFWLPDVFAGASAPVAGFLSVVPKVAGLAALLRLFAEAFPDGALHGTAVLAALAAATMSFGNLAALRQRRLKRLLAYSTIAQAGYLLMAVAPAGAGHGGGPAVAYYLGAYLFMNLGAFAVVAQLERSYGTDALDAVRGLGRRAPFAAAVLALSLLSLAGIPPLGGFAGKVLLLAAAIDGGYGWLAVVAVLNWVVALAYYLGVLAPMYLSRHGAPPPLRRSLGFSIAHSVNACGMLWLGILPALPLHVAAWVAP